MSQTMSEHLARKSGNKSTFHQPCKAIGSTYIIWTVATFSQCHIDFQTHPHKAISSTCQRTGHLESYWTCPFLPHKTSRWIYEQSQKCWFVFTYFSPPTLPYKTIRWTDEENWHFEPGNILNLWKKLTGWVLLIGLPHQNTTFNIVEHMNQRSILSYV